jgi:SAM-dependent methyltransferase
MERWDLMNEYDLFAHLYDLEHRDFVDDIELYRSLAQRCDGPVLELGCGSGRVCLALAEAGFEGTGIDISEEMLALARAHAADAGLADQVLLERADVRSLSFDSTYALALYPCNGFVHLLTAEDQLAALRSIHRALLDGGFLVIDLPNPHAVLDVAADGHLLLRKRFTSPEGHTVTSFTCSQTDLAGQRQDLLLVYDEEDDRGAVRRTTVELEIRFVYRREMALLLRQAGFAIDGVYGTYDLDPYEAESEQMIYLAHRV